MISAGYAVPVLPGRSVSMSPAAAAARPDLATALKRISRFTPAMPMADRSAEIVVGISGVLSPVIAASFTEATPSITSPSTGIRSPGSTSTISSLHGSLAGMIDERHSCEAAEDEFEGHVLGTSATELHSVPGPGARNGSMRNLTPKHWEGKKINAFHMVAEVARERALWRRSDVRPIPSATCPRDSVLPIRLRPDFSVVFEGYAGGAVNRHTPRKTHRRSLRADILQTC